MHGEGPAKLKRAHSLIMKIEADSQERLLAELENVQRRILLHDMTRGTMGGYSASSIYSYCYDPDMTHDEYFEKLDAWLEQERESKRLTPSED